MSVRIRLAKVGKTHQVSYRIVAQDSKAPRDGKFLEIIGFFNPHLDSEKGLKIDKVRLDHWLHAGARPTSGVVKLISNHGRTA